MADVKNAPTLYRSKREALGWSREHAAEQIGISDDKLERIENGKQLPNPQDVLLMSDVYQAPELCNYYCSHDCPIGRKYVPEIREKLEICTAAEVATSAVAAGAVLVPPDPLQAVRLIAIAIETPINLRNHFLLITFSSL